MKLIKKVMRKFPKRLFVNFNIPTSTIRDAEKQMKFYNAVIFSIPVQLFYLFIFFFFHF